MKKILYIHNTDISKATANLTQVISMCNAFSEASAETVLLLPKDKSHSDNDLISSLKLSFSISDSLRINFFCNPFSNYKVNKNTNFTRVFSLLKNEYKDFDYIFVRHVLYALAAILANKKVLFESHDNKVHNGSKVFNFILTKLILRLSKSKNFIKFISISHNLADYWIKKGLNRNKSLAIHDGFNSASYEIQTSREEARARLGISLQDKTIVYTGNIVQNRGINYIIEAAIQLPDIVFYIVGGPSAIIDFYRHKYDFSAIRNIKFIGQVPHKDIVDYQLSANILLAIWSNAVPTINYCSPLKLFEYMATGVPFIAAGYIPIKEVLKGEFASFVFKPDNVQSLVDKIKEVLRESDKYHLLANQARNNAFEQYTWNSRVLKIIDSI